MKIINFTIELCVLNIQTNFDFLESCPCTQYIYCPLSPYCLVFLSHPILWQVNYWTLFDFTLYNGNSCVYHTAPLEHLVIATGSRGISSWKWQKFVLKHRITAYICPKMLHITITMHGIYTLLKQTAMFLISYAGGRYIYFLSFAYICYNYEPLE